MRQRGAHKNENEYKQEIQDARQAVRHDIDDVFHHRHVAQMLQHFDPSDDAVKCKNIFPHHNPKSRVVVRYVILVCRRKPLRRNQLTGLSQRPESTQIGDSEQRKIRPIHGKPAAHEKMQQQMTTEGEGPRIGGLVAEDAVFADELQFHDNIDENLHDKVIKDADKQRDYKIGNFCRI
jgi:hypothetical protein